MSDPIKFTQEEMDEVFSLQQDYNTTLLNLGGMELERMNLAARLKELDEAKDKLVSERFAALNAREKELLGKITEKYGEGSLSLRDGTFTPSSKTSNIELK
jgi:hypothetical protein